MTVIKHPRSKAQIPSGQSKLGSFIEACANIVVGFSINFVANMLILPLFGFDKLTAQIAFNVGLVFTAISLVRSYVLRRVFNRIKASWASN